MKQVKLFSSFNDPEKAVSEVNFWIAAETKKAEKDKTSFEHSEPQVTALNNQFIITVTYTA